MEEGSTSVKSLDPIGWSEGVGETIKDCDGKGLLGGKIMKEDLSKFTDSACESLNESEESGSKYQENVLASSSDVPDRVESEKDSLECEDDGEELYESEEESVDNNTFNIINTENSESQEISELTNEDSSNYENREENETQSTASQGETKGNSTHTSSETQNYSVSVSEENTGEEEGEFDNSLEDEETSHSKLSEERSSSDSSNEIKEIKTEIERPQTTKSEIQSNSKISSETSVAPINFIRTLKAVHPDKQQSPKLKKRCGKPILNNKNNKNDFIIEIFESKRKPDISTISDNSEKLANNDSTTVKSEKVTNQDTLTLKNLETQNNGENRYDKLDRSLDSSQSSDYKQLTLTMDSLSPESFDKTSSILLDISQVIKEENEDSDALSPLKSLVVDDALSSPRVPSPIPSADTSRKQLESKFPTSPSSDSKTSPLSNSLNENSTTPERPSVTPRKNDPHPSPVDTPPNAVTKPPTPMAFTIELGDSAASDSSGSGSTGKKLDISASISQWAPKHRRNLSLTKVDEHKKIEERQNSDKPPLGRPRAGTVGAGSLGNRKGGYHSEGYFSSDQDDEGTKRIDLKSPRSPRAHDAVKSPLSIVRSSSQESSKDNSARYIPPDICGL